MLRTVCLLFATLALAGTASAQAVIGTWKIDLKSLETGPEMAKMPPDQRAQAMEMGRKMLGQMSLEAKAGGEAVMTIKPGMSQSGTWAKDAKGGFTLTFDGTTKAITVQGDRLTLLEAGTTLAFDRVGAVKQAKGEAPLAGAALPAALQATWKLDPAATVAAAPADKAEKIKRMADKMKAVSLIIGKGTLEMTDGTRSQKGTFTISRLINTDATINVTETGKTRTETMQLSLKGKHLHATIDGDTMVFSR